jgi:murein DD-endopeptidase MepM/ murein hydrolase activator NlpD
MIALCVVAMLTLSGCIGLLVKPYGFVAFDAEKVRKDGSAIFIPENAPSIIQGYTPKPLEKSQTAASTGHNGIDIYGKTGIPVIAAATGIVINSYYELFYGNRIVIDHGQDENGLFIISRYLHLKKRLVKKGDNVVRGQQIGTLGRTGLQAAFIPHVHYEIRMGVELDQFKTEPMNPHRFWVDGVGVVTCFDSSRQWADRLFKTTYPVPCRGVD